MTKFKFHRGTLQESMATMIEVEDKDDLVAKLNASGELAMRGKEQCLSKDQLRIKPYMHDERIDWNLYIVLFQDGVLGFTDGPLKS